jgi:hypothetical protein
MTNADILRFQKDFFSINKLDHILKIRFGKKYYLVKNITIIVEDKEE